ncbi:SymE family type I addiction module toxin [Stenotrophomonas sp.]|uniref:SymE family type I addiction module toxin n=1 Tax=Stenotrophomonas sp. TaxID=69392 RepID=UPI0028A8FD03|nr:SymE family type I addiction module toxin [Stenotrophomonas sp.]
MHQQFDQPQEAVTSTAAPRPSTRHFPNVHSVPTDLQEQEAATPSIYLRGPWLRRLGFEPGEQIRADCIPGEITITLATPSPSSDHAIVRFSEVGGS